MIKVLYLFTTMALLESQPLKADDLSIAVASNFASTAKKLISEFQKSSSHKIFMSSGSTGKLYAQIKNGAPYSIFMSADRDRPELLEKQGLTVAGSRFTYAKGQLVFWTSGAKLFTEKMVLRHLTEAKTMALANPKFAPYGIAAKQVLKNLKKWKTTSSSRVYGENIGQTFGFIYSGNAQSGFVAYSQVIKVGISPNHYWIIPDRYFSPIDQQVVQLKNSSVAQKFISFLQSPQAKALIKNSGYLIQ